MLYKYVVLSILLIFKFRDRNRILYIAIDYSITKYRVHWNKKTQFGLVVSRAKWQSLWLRARWRWLKIARHDFRRIVRQYNCIVIRAGDAAACIEIRKKPVALASNQHTRRPFLRHLSRSLAMWLLTYPYSLPFDPFTDSPG